LAGGEGPGEDVRDAEISLRTDMRYTMRNASSFIFITLKISINKTQMQHTCNYYFEKKDNILATQCPEALLPNSFSRLSRPHPLPK